MHGKGPLSALFFCAISMTGPTRSFRSIALIPSLLALLGLLAWLAYRPGLHGGFVFDDFANLPSLGADGPINNGPSALRYITSGKADPTGRPLSVASFLIDANNWPADPYPFKRNNVLLHILNGWLLFAVMRTLGQRLRLTESRASIAAAMGAGAWLIHPFFVSTVLYVVQREAMLPATFALLAILASFASRRCVARGQNRQASLWLLMGVGGCATLGALAKANGLLIPLLVLIVDAAVPPAKSVQTRGFKAMRTLVLGVPTACVVGWLAWVALASAGQPPLPERGWTTMQRLLTEPTILWDYVARLWFVLPVQGSLLHDDTPVAASLLTPWYTLPALVAWLSLAAAAWHLRRRFPALALAVLFYLGAHLMESSSLGLELYFEHRNYLPAMFMFWPAAIMLSSLRSRSVRLIAAGGAAALLATTTWGQAWTWADPWRMASAWANARPDSPRAQAYAAQIALLERHPDAAIRLIDQARNTFADEPQVATSLINVHCATGILTSKDIAYASQAFANTRRDPGVLLMQWMDSRIDAATRGACPALTLDALEDLTDVAQANSHIAASPGRLQDILHVRGQMALARKDPAQALRWFNQALSLAPGPAVALAQAARLGEAGLPSEGLRHLAYYRSLPDPTARTWRDGMPWIHDRVLVRQHYWETEFSHLQATLRAAAGS